jgi:hypothetical protein
MASAKQIAANGKNARKSTGPRTEAGKAHSRLNALSHGVRAQQVILPGEDEHDLTALREALHEELLPTGPLQEELFEMIVDGFWRLRRCRRAEGGILWAKIMMRRQLKKLSGLDSESPAVPGELDPEALELGLAYAAAAESLGKLDRYETSIVRRIERATRELERLQADDTSQVVERDNIIEVEAEPEGDVNVPTTVGDRGNVS